MLTVHFLFSNHKGYTIRVNSGSAAAPTEENVAGYAAQFGFRGADARTVPFTRNEVGVFPGCLLPEA